MILRALLLFFFTCLSQAGEKPNILILTADDLSASSVGAFGGKLPGLTPHIDRLAAEGIRFEKARVITSICQPSRQALMTGVLPHRQGAPGFFPIREFVPTIGDHLKPQGYYLGAINKLNHMQPEKRFRWDRVSKPGEVPEGRAPKANAELVREMIRSAAAQKAPFFINCNSQDPHRPFHEGEGWTDKYRKNPKIEPPSRIYTAAEVSVPGFLPDLPEIREEMAHYSNSVKRLDDTVGLVLKVLEEEGVAQNTLVMFWSDHGMAFPFSKSTLYPEAMRTPWIVRWPGHVKPGVVDGAHYITSLDMVPTLLDILDLQVPEIVDGKSFLALLRGEEQFHREDVITVFHGRAEEARYESRAVEKDGWLYIFNAWSLETDRGKVYQMESMDGLSFAAMEKAAATDPKIADRVKMLLYRAPEELYHLAKDPHCLSNVAKQKAELPRMNAMREQLDSWMRAKEDELLPFHRSYLSKVKGSFRADGTK
jgi:N-sulfoglucosamine sulfohydrolase